MLFFHHASLCKVLSLPLVEPDPSMIAFSESNPSMLISPMLFDMRKLMIHIVLLDLRESSIVLV